MAWFYDWFFIICSVAFFAAALFYGWQIICQKDRMEDSQSWPTTTAVVISKQIKVSQAYGQRGTIYTPQIDYAYSALGQDVSRTISIKKPRYVRGSLFHHQQEIELGDNAIKAAKRDLSKTAPTFEIRYNPENPTDHICPFSQVRNDMPRLVLTSLIGLSYLFLFILIRR